MTANDCYRPPIDAQLRYTVQWFHEWSEMQRGDFLPILAQKLSPGNYVNGLLSGVETLSCNEGRPPSLFQCRIKLFREWFGTWSQAERDQLLNHIKSMDPGFYDKVQEELQTINGKTGNGPVPAEVTDEEPSTPDDDKQEDIVNGEPADQANVAEGDECEDQEVSADVPTENGDE